MRLKQDEVVNHLKYDVYVRLKPSPLGGIGVFAIRDISAGIDPFQERQLETSFVRVPLKQIVDDPEIPSEAKQYVYDLCSCENGFLWFPRFGLNGVMPLFYLNHSKDPSVENTVVAGGATYFRTIRRIKTGEELTVDYSTYDELDPLSKK